jgi:chorismate synthase
MSSYGESHCLSVGAIVDGCPPGMALTDDDIQPQMTRRRPGQSAITTPRNEKDRVEIQSGTEFGITLGTPIGLRVMNENQRKQDYGNKTMDLYPRPSHADWTYLEKYGVKASSGGGRSSARETIGESLTGHDACAEQANNMQDESQQVRSPRSTYVRHTALRSLHSPLQSETNSSSLPPPNIPQPLQTPNI